MNATIASIKADRYSNRAPKGGAISPVNGRFYAGGQFMPMAAEIVEVKPAALQGSTRQILWATRLRKEAIARLEEQLYAARLELTSNRPYDAAATRRAIRRDETARFALMTTTVTAKVIEMRTAMA